MVKALEIIGLTKNYRNGTPALKGIDLSIEAGDFFALLGHNGAGKSTTIGIVSSLVNKTSGQVKIFGYDLDRQSAQAKAQIGIVPQEFNFNQFETLLDILIYQAGFYGVERKQALSRAEQWLKKLELWDKKDKLAISLSGGMKRRLMIARALMHQPKLLILDEPTAGVDIEIRHALWDFLKELNEQGTTIILTTHYFEEAEMLCRNVAILQAGKITHNFAMKELHAWLKSDSLILNISGKLSLPLADYQMKVLDQNTLEVIVDPSQGLNNLFIQLEAQGVKVMSLRNKANRLETFFIDMMEKERE